MAYGVVEPFNRCRFPGFLSYLGVRQFGQAVVRAPKVAEAVAPARQLSPEPFTGLRRAVADEERQYLPGFPALRNPNAHLVDFHLNKSENLVNLHHVGGSGGVNGLLEGAQ